MPTPDPRIDAYLDAAAPFARPLLATLRERVHAAGMGLEETIKWGAPTFTHRGRLVCTIAGFKQHVALAFHHGGRVVGEAARAGAMGQFGRITSAGELPDTATVAACVRAACALIDAGTTRPRTPAVAKPLPELPDDFAAAIAAVPAARATFDAFPPGERREYVAWIVEARREATRASRIAQAVEWLAEGKRRNWKYRGDPGAETTT